MAHQHVERVHKVDTREEPVSDTANYGMTVAERIIWFVAGVLLVLLAFRFVLAALGANPNNAFASFIYDASRPFVEPFFNLFNYSFQSGVARFELFTLVAMAVYAVIAWGLARLVTLPRGREEV